MKTLLILTFIFMAAAAEEFHMKLNENGEEFTEDIKIDVAGNTEEINVPQHQDRAALDQLNDFNVGLSALKLPKSKRCYITAMAASEQRPKKLKESMELAHSRFPTERYMVETFKTLVVRKMTAEEVGVKIAAHCNGHELLLAINFNKENIEKEALKLLKGKSKRDVNVGDFVTCNFMSVNVVRSCPRSKLGAKCSFYRSDRRVCAYQVTCKPSSSGSTCVGNHRYNLLQCCDFYCMP